VSHNSPEAERVPPHAKHPPEGVALRARGASGAQEAGIGQSRQARRWSGNCGCNLCNAGNAREVVKIGYVTYGNLKRGRAFREQRAGSWHEPGELRFGGAIGAERRLSNLARARRCGARTRAGRPCRPGSGNGSCKVPNARLGKHAPSAGGVTHPLPGQFALHGVDPLIFLEGPPAGNCSAR
jgi:hypothetical protein